MRNKLLRSASNISIGALAVLAFSIGSTGCGSAPEEGAQEDEAAITADEAARAASFSALVLRDHPAKHATKLGVTGFSVFTRIQDSFEGVLLLATDSDGDVRYGIVVDGEAGALNVLEYTKVGEKGSATLSAESYAALHADFEAILADLKAQAARGGDVTVLALNGGVACARDLAILTVGALMYTVTALTVGEGTQEAMARSAIAALGGSGGVPVASIQGSVVVHQWKTVKASCSKA